MFLVSSLAIFPAEAHDQDSRYLAAQPVTVITIWCGEGGHTYTPHGAPDLDRPTQWLFSGEPECAPGDHVLGTDGPHGINGAPVEVEAADLGTVLTVTAEDDATDAPYLHTRIGTFGGEDETADSCGSLSVLLPLDMELTGWYGDRLIVWVSIDGAHVDPDTLETCFATTGTLHAS